MSVYDLLIDVAIASILILAGQLLRAKIPVFQKFFVPASMIAGFIGLPWENRDWESCRFRPRLDPTRGC